MIKKFHVINPAPVKKKKRRTGLKKKSTGKKAGIKPRLNPGKGRTMATRKKGAGRKPRRAKKNPVVTYQSSRKPGTARIVMNPKKRKVSRKRYRRNPDAPSMDPLKANNALQYGAGIAAGVFVPPIIGNMLGFSGNAKYLTQLAIGFAGFMLAKKMGVPKAGLSFLISAAAVTGLEFSMDYGIMQGAHTLLGVPYAPPRLNGMVPLMGMIPGRQPGLNGMVAYNQPLRMSGTGPTSGYDN